MTDSLEGIYPELNAEQRDKVGQLLGRVQGGKIPCPPSYTDWLSHHPTLFMVKWLVARKWDVDKAFEMYRDAAAYRLAEELETKPLFPATVPVRGYDEAELARIYGAPPRPTDQFVDKASASLRKVYSGGWHKWDKHGRPVFIERTGLTKARELVDRCRALVPPGEPVDPVIAEPHKQSNEVGATILRLQNEKLKAEGRFVAQIVAVMDCTGMSMGTLYGPAMELLKVNSETDQKYFPEGLHRTYVVNAPRTVKVGWALIRMWLDPNLQDKVIFCGPGEPTRTALLEAIDEEHLPCFLGGKCNCEGGCVPDLEPSDGATGGCGADGGPQTLELFVKARNKLEHPVAVTAGTVVSWTYIVQTKKSDVGFSATFVPATADEHSASAAPMPIIPSSKQTKGDGSFTAPSDGVLELLFDNTYAWMYGKTMHLRVETTEPKE